MARKTIPKKPKTAPARRNPVAKAVRKMGLRVMPSIKAYKRRPKHSKSESGDS